VLAGSSISDSSGPTNKIFGNNLPVATRIAVTGTGC
jgi:hypothetical protein